MANHLRFRSGPVQLVKANVDSASVVEPGDLVYLDTSVVRPASEFTWDTNLATTQASFADVFVGVSHERSEAGDTAPISVDISPHAIYEFDADISDYTLGQLVGPDEDSSTLMNQQLEAVAASARGVARCMEFTNGFVTRVRVSFASAFSTGSASTAADVA